MANKHIKIASPSFSIKNTGIVVEKSFNLNSAELFFKCPLKVFLFRAAFPLLLLFNVG